MLHAARRQPLVLIAALAMLSVRALTPAGYMPGSPASGLLYELCPAGMPAAVMQALGGGHHHHHDSAGGVAGDEQCPIGHMLAVAVAVDNPDPTGLVPGIADFEAPLPASPRIARIPTYRSRAPPPA
jgi:hypothetical protein